VVELIKNKDAISTLVSSTYEFSSFAFHISRAYISPLYSKHWTFSSRSLPVSGRADRPTRAAAAAAPGLEDSSCHFKDVWRPVQRQLGQIRSRDEL